MSRKLLFLPVVLFLALIEAGCSSLLPSTRDKTESPWATFDEAKAAFDRIEVNKTTKEELRQLGFDPFSTPNIRILTHLDIIQKFMANPSIKKEDLDEGLQTCVNAKTNCSVYAVEPKAVSTKRLGNVWLDLLNFKRRTKETGWRFEALIVMVNDLVIYKIWGGNPFVDEYKERRNPLGPLQGGDLPVGIIR